MKQLSWTIKQNHCYLSNANKIANAQVDKPLFS